MGVGLLSKQPASVVYVAVRGMICKGLHSSMYVRLPPGQALRANAKRSHGVSVNKGDISMQYPKEELRFC